LEEVNETLYAWLKKLEPCGMHSEEPVFIAEKLRVAAPPRVMKERHIRLRIASDQGTTLSAVGWNCAEKLQPLQLEQNTRIDLAYKIRKSNHPDFGGLELEIADLRPTQPDANSL
jgi:single-stranded-DNA-specific exonuclease